MAGRIGYFVIAGVALLGGMVMQGDSPFRFGGPEHDSGVDRSIDQRVDRIVEGAIDLQVDRMVTVRGKNGEDLDLAPDAKRALAGAVAELVRAEGSLAMVDEEEGAAALAKARARRDAARQAVDQLAEQAKAESRTNRDELRREIRDEVRAAVRS